MSDKNSDILALSQELPVLIQRLVQAKSDHDDALKHAAEYMGDNERIEKHRDERAFSALEHKTNIQNDVLNKLQDLQNKIKNNG
ncbi:hypothetical protein HWA77_16875 [Photobacterium damselae subsp. damselae]|uniref:Uncharacterized protein n=1 Tax=Photobacterium damselae subsp. damselae TaxID=85581 RepID=A0A850QZ70_PHODD|nr:hypothetical protein [Photobacterium damselae subsp. damselae]